MARTSSARLRPETIRSKPVRMDKVFDDPERVIETIRARAPFPTMVAYMGHGVPDAGPVGIPWFLDRPDEAFIVENPQWYAAAREAFDCEIVRPIHVTLNLNGPAPLGLPHIDQPKFRGVGEDGVPLWMQMAMSRSGLFIDWLAPVASGLVWFWKGEGGEFEYWPDGADAPSVIAERPMWNTGVMSDNEVMWHRVGAFGPPDQQDILARQLRTDAMLHRTGSGWEVRQNGDALLGFADGDVRLAMLWKAYVFKDGAHLASFEDQRFDLDLDQITDIFQADLGERGIDVARPDDPESDDAWRLLLDEIYKTPFD